MDNEFPLLPTTIKWKDVDLPNLPSVVHPTAHTTFAGDNWEHADSISVPSEQHLAKHLPIS